MQRAGRDEIVSAKLENPSLEDDLECAVQLTAPSGLTLLDPAVQQVSIWTKNVVFTPSSNGSFGPYKVEKSLTKTLSWRMRASEALTGDLQVTVTGPRSPTVDRTLHANITPAVSLSPADYVPEPAVVASPDYYVGANYYSAWTVGAANCQWGAVKTDPTRKPVLGYYDESDPETMDWQIKYALEHGIDFFNFCEH